MVLFVQKNNAFLLENQLAQVGFSGNTADVTFAYQSTENTLGLIAIAAILIGAVGGLSLIGLRNQSCEKSMVMMHFFGMQKKDLVIKALVDTLSYAFLSSCVGFYCGYRLFLHFYKQILQADGIWSLFSLRKMAILSFQSVAVFCETLAVIAFLVFFGNLYIDLKIMEKSIVQSLYQRKGGGGKHNYLYILVAEVSGVLLYSLLIFHVKASYLFTIGVMALLLSFVLFSVFHLFFGVFTKKSRKNRKVRKAKDLSFVSCAAGIKETRYWPS